MQKKLDTEMDDYFANKPVEKEEEKAEEAEEAVEEKDDE